MVPALEILYEPIRGVDLPLPPELATLYGRLSFPLPGGRPYVISNFVSTLDGAVSLDAAGKAVEGDLNGPALHDRIVMGLLRATADVVIVGAGTLRSSPQHIGTAEHIFPPFAGPYNSLREAMGKRSPHLNVVITASGNVDHTMPIFHSDIPVLLVTTATGAEQVNSMNLPGSVQVVAGTTTGSLSAGEILGAIRRIRPSCEIILVEGGSHLMGDFFTEGCMDELFLTFAPQVAGRLNSLDRMGFVAGRIFAPENPLWANLVSVKRGGSHLFLRYAFNRKASGGG